MSAQRSADDMHRAARLSWNAGTRGGSRVAMHILLIEPDAVVAQRLADMLRPEYNVVVATTAHGAITSMLTRMPDLVITEIDLPDANGVELVARWRVAADTQHTLFIVVTARRSVRDKISSFQAGADDYLVKPVAPEQFLLHVRMVSRFRRLIHGPLTGPNS